MIEPRHIQQACERTLEALLLATEKPSPKLSGGGGGSSIEPPMPLPAGVISAKRELRDMLLDWVGLVSEGLEVVAHCDPTEPSMLAWLGSGERADYLAGHDAGMDYLDEITALTRQLESPYLPRAGKKYIGWHGGGDVYVRDGQTEVTLENGETHRVASIRAFNASQMLEREGTASQVADIIKAFFGHDVKPQRIIMAHKNDKRKQSGTRLESVRQDGNSHIYKVWDVLNRLC